MEGQLINKGVLNADEGLVVFFWMLLKSEALASELSCWPYIHGRKVSKVRVKQGQYFPLICFILG